MGNTGKYHQAAKGRMIDLATSTGFVAAAESAEVRSEVTVPRSALYRYAAEASAISDLCGEVMRVC